MSTWNIKIEKSSGEVWVYQQSQAGNQLFLARFKYARPMINARAFVKFLSANFTPEEYFERYANGTPPLIILKARGYVSPNEARAAQFTARFEAAAVSGFTGSPRPNSRMWR